MFFIYIVYYSVETCRITNYTDVCGRVVTYWLYLSILKARVYYGRA